MVLAIAMGVALLLQFVATTPLLQNLELGLYDHLKQNWSTPANHSPPVTLIAIDEQDIRTLGTWPISDALLTELLEKLLHHRPTVVTIDLYRDLKVGAGRERLNELLAENPNILAVTLLGEGEQDAIPPPQALLGTDRAVANDILLDRDGVVRRGLLYLDDGRTIYSSLALQTALLHLAHSGIRARPDPERVQHLRLGETTFKPLQRSDGGYRNIDTHGYQFLLNFHMVLIMAGLSFLYSYPDAQEKQPEPASQNKLPAKDKISIKKDQGLPLPVYKPPRRGAPKGRVGGGTRGYTPRGQAIKALAPTHIGLTLLEQPTLYWFMRKPALIEFQLSRLEHLGERLIFTQRLQPQENAVVMKIDLSKHDVHLVAGEQYVWQVEIHSRTGGAVFSNVSSGLIERVPTPPALVQDLNKERQKALVYAEHGLWYDALMDLTLAMEHHPDRQDYRLQRSSLLRQIGIDNTTQWP